MAGGSNGYRAALVRCRHTLVLISSLPGTAGLPPFIFFFRQAVIHRASRRCNVPLVLGVVICMDLEEPLAGCVIVDLRTSTAPKKLLCMPAAMSSSAGWTFDSPTASRYDGIHFAVSNRSD